VNPKSTSNQSSKSCTVLQYPSRKICRIVLFYSPSFSIGSIIFFYSPLFSTIRLFSIGSIVLFAMGWLRLVGSLKLQVSIEEYSLFYRALLQKRLIVLRSLLIIATLWSILFYWLFVFFYIRWLRKKL